MKIGLIYFFSSMLSLGFIWYSSIDLQNEVTQLRMKIPEVSKQVKRIEQENIRLQYEIDIFESPDNLMRFARLPEYQHLKYPLCHEIVALKEEMPLLLYAENSEKIPTKPKSKLTFAIGANP
jgi:hypothetical protein